MDNQAPFQDRDRGFKMPFSDGKEAENSEIFKPPSATETVKKWILDRKTLNEEKFSEGIKKVSTHFLFIAKRSHMNAQRKILIYVVKGRTSHRFERLPRTTPCVHRDNRREATKSLFDLPERFGDRYLRNLSSRSTRIPNRDQLLRPYVIYHTSITIIQAVVVLHSYPDYQRGATRPRIISGLVSLVSRGTYSGTQ
jgi:hypothetical protein